jgi:hypothetical protein
LRIASQKSLSKNLGQVPRVAPGLVPGFFVVLFIDVVFATVLQNTHADQNDRASASAHQKPSRRYRKLPTRHIFTGDFARSRSPSPIPPKLRVWVTFANAQKFLRPSNNLQRTFQRDPKIPVPQALPRAYADFTLAPHRPSFSHRCTRPNPNDSPNACCGKTLRQQCNTCGDSVARSIGASRIELR